jgi:alkylation response protein AidB-like acyl-CoA dehydrogenase
MALSQQALKEMKHQRGHGLRNAATFIAPIDGLSHVSGDRSQALLHKTIPVLFKETVATYGPREAAVFVEQGRRFTWDQLAEAVDAFAAGLLALGIAAVALGNARSAIDDLVELAAAKQPQGSRRTLAERGSAQTALAMAEADLRSARAFFYETVAEAWRVAQDTGRVDVRQRALLRLAATNATRRSADVTRAMYDLAGGSSVFLSSPLQRRFRDAHVATQHLMIAPPTYELTGRVLMGLPIDAATPL